MRKQTIIALMMFVTMFVVASNVMPTLFSNILSSATSTPTSRDQQQKDSIVVDSLNNALDSLLLNTADTMPAHLKDGEPDTTLMDSIQLAIYKHNKAIDDSLALDSINRQRKNGIEAPVEYQGNDSMIYMASSNTAHIYGDAKVNYENMKLESEIIHLSLDSSLVRAEGVTDSLGEKTGTPIFNMGSDKYESDKMAFNFKTKKGLINNVYTEQEDGFMTSTLSKRDSTGAVYMQKGRYTTCDADHPDFYIALTRAKVRPGKDVIFGPAYLVVADVPLPLAIPYGFFPFSKSYSSGFIMPTYGDEMDRGFYLRDGGYYFAISDKMDLKLLGEIYTKGSWGISAASNYRKRYKYSGTILMSYQNSITGDKGMDDYSKTTSFKIQWSHRQEQTASPQQLNASVNFATSQYERNNLTALYDATRMSESTRASSVSWSTSFASLGLSLSASTRIEQNMRDTTLSVTLPDLNITVARFFPFKRKKAAGNERWYEKIYLSYTGQIANSINTKEEKVMHSSLSKDWSNGWNHSIPIAAAFTLFNFINVTPSFTFTDRTYLNKLHKSWDDTSQKEQTDTLRGFYNVYNWSLDLNMSTSLYGFYVPSRKIFGDKVVAIRHVLKPTVRFSYAPNFANSSYGFWDSYQYTDANGNLMTKNYSCFEGFRYGGVSNTKTGSVSWGFSNNLEMKVRSDKDTTGFKKISLIDELGWSMGYNFAAVTKPLSDLTVNLRLKWFKNWDFSTTAVFKTYAYEVVTDANGKETVRESDRTEYSFGRFGRYQGISQNFSFTLTPEKIKKWFNPELRDKDKDNNKKSEDDDMDTGLDTNLDDKMVKTEKAVKKKSGKATTDEDGYMAFSMPWALTFSYGITMSENTSGEFNKETMRYPYKFSHNFNFNGNVRISDGWNISFNSGYDFNNHSISVTHASLSRDLHCFSMSCSVTLAPYTSYNFSFRCNAATLADALKYDKQSSYSNAVQWY